MKLNNTYYLARHGQAFSNVERWFSSWPEKRISRLTPKGINQAKSNAKYFKNVGLDLIISSDLLRTKQTAKIIAKKTNTRIIFEKGFREIDFGDLNGDSIAKYNAQFKNQEERFDSPPPGTDENFTIAQKRLLEALLKIDKRYKNKNILIVSHASPMWLLESAVQGRFGKNALDKKNFIPTGGYKKLRTNGGR